MAGESAFDRFTAATRRVFALSQMEAQRLNHGYIGTEHLLLGLLGEDEGVAAKVLVNLGVELARVRSAVENIVGRGDRLPFGHMSLTSRAKAVIELAVDEAQRLDHRHIGTEHLLLGLVREGQGIAAGVLASLGLALPRVRAETLRVLAAEATGSAGSGSAPKAHGIGFIAAHPERLAPPLGPFRRVVPVGQHRAWRTFALTVLSLEAFEQGFTVQMRLELDPNRTFSPAPLDNLPFSAVDDTGQTYHGGGSASVGSLDGMRTLNERWLSPLFTPSLNPDARELRLTVPPAWLVGSTDGAETGDTAELQTFVIRLGGA